MSQQLDSIRQHHDRIDNALRHATANAAEAARSIDNLYQSLLDESIDEDAMIDQLFCHELLPSSNSSEAASEDMADPLPALPPTPNPIESPRPIVRELARFGESFAAPEEFSWLSLMTPLPDFEELSDAFPDLPPAEAHGGDLSTPEASESDLSPNVAESSDTDDELDDSEITDHLDRFEVASRTSLSSSSSSSSDEALPNSLEGSIPRR